MNALILMAALAGGQCESGTCAVELTVEAMVVAPLHHEAKRSPVRKLVRRVRGHRPVRTWWLGHPVRRLFIRRCR